MLRIAIFIPIAVLCLWSVAGWLLQWRWRVHKAYGTAYGVIILVTNVVGTMVVFAAAAAGLLFGDLWELLFIPVGVLVITNLRSLGEWWIGALDLEDYGQVIPDALRRARYAGAGRLDLVEYGPVIPSGYRPRSIDQLILKVAPVQLAGLAASFALLGTAAHMAGNTRLQFDMWALAVVLGVAWILSPFMLAALVGAVRRWRGVAVGSDSRSTSWQTNQDSGQPGVAEVERMESATSVPSRTWNRNFDGDDEE